jgi:hypothetical protein
MKNIAPEYCDGSTIVTKQNGYERNNLFVFQIGGIEIFDLSYKDIFDEVKIDFDALLLVVVNVDVITEVREAELLSYNILDENLHSPEASHPLPDDEYWKILRFKWTKSQRFASYPVVRK